MKKILAALYSIFAYLLFLVAALYLMGFLGNFIVPKTISSDAGGSMVRALIINLGLLSVFAIQHSLMARESFKKWITSFMNPAIERSTYVILSSLVLLLLYWQWQPMPIVIWEVKTEMIYLLVMGLFGLGWIIVLASTFMINHFELLGLQQVFFNLIGKEPEINKFKVVGFYKYVRHPLYLGFIIGVWATPVMTLTHFFFASGILAYILIGIFFEEKDLIVFHGNKYSEYKQKVAMLIPNFSK